MNGPSVTLVIGPPKCGKTEFILRHYSYGTLAIMPTDKTAERFLQFYDEIQNVRSRWLLLQSLEDVRDHPNTDLFITDIDVDNDPSAGIANIHSLSLLGKERGANVIAEMTYFDINQQKHLESLLRAISGAQVLPLCLNGAKASQVKVDCDQTIKFIAQFESAILPIDEGGFFGTWS